MVMGFYSRATRGDRIEKTLNLKRKNESGLTNDSTVGINAKRIKRMLTNTLILINLVSSLVFAVLFGGFAFLRIIIFSYNNQR